MIRWLRARPLTMAYLLIVLSFTAAMAGVAWEAEQRREALCETVNEQQALVHRLVDVVLERPESEGLRLTTLPEFRSLDPETQAYLIALEARSAGSTDDDGIEARLRRFADSLQPAECS